MNFSRETLRESKKTLGRIKVVEEKSDLFLLINNFRHNNNMSNLTEDPRMAVKKKAKATKKAAPKATKTE